MPYAQKARGSSSSTQELETASVSLPDWTLGGGMAVLNEAAQDVRTRLQAQAAALKNYNQEFLATQTAIQVSLLLFAFCSCILLWVRIIAPIGCSPRVPGWLLSRRPGNSK